MMVKASRTGSNNSLTARPVLTGDSRVDHALRLLSSILAEIAEQVIQNKNEGSASIKNQIQKRSNNVQAIPLIKDSGIG